MSGVKQVLKEVLFGERQQPRYSSLGTTGTAPTNIVTPPSTLPASEQLSMGEQVKTDVEVLRRAPVVREVIHPLEKHEVSPVIYREREKTEIRQVEQPIYETIQKPTIVREASLPAETRPVVQAQMGDFDLRYKEGMQQYQPSVTYAPVEREVVTKAPVVIETIRKHVKEEIQPVIYREVLQQEVIRETKPIYEKIVEAPSLVRVQAQPLYETRSLQENLPLVGTTTPIGMSTGGFSYTTTPIGMSTGTGMSNIGSGGILPATGTTMAPNVQGGFPVTGTPSVSATTGGFPGGIRETKVTLTEATQRGSSHWNTASS